MFTITLVIFLVVDMIWLAGIARKFYRKELGALMRARPKWSAAVLFYLVYAAGIVFFVIQPSIGGSGTYAFLRGAGFGFVAYCTYDLTGLAVIENWPVRIAIMDILWGSLATGLTAFLVVQLL